MELYKMSVNELTDEDILLWEQSFDDTRKTAVNSKTEHNRKLSICGDLLVLKIAKANGHFGELIINRDTNGKPFFDNISLCFSVSHKNDTAVCVASEKNIGIDIEDIKPFKEATANRICTAEELMYIGNDPSRFAEIWTIKEAFAKFDGRGISIGFSNIITDMKNLTVNGVPFKLLYFDSYVCAVVSEE